MVQKMEAGQLGLQADVVFFDVIGDRLFEVANAVECSTTDAFRGDLRRKAVHLIQPGSGCRREVNLVPQTIGVWGWHSYP